jgi:Protein of unknown function (DUF3107)
VEVKIGIQSAPRELIVETESDADDIEAALKAAIADSGVLAVSTAKGGRVLVPADKIAYLEFGDSQARRVGFSNL